MQNLPARTELGRWMIEFVRKLVAGEYAFYCTCTNPDPRGKWCENCGGHRMNLGYWLES